MNIDHLLSPRGRLGQRGFLILAGGLLVASLVAGALPGIGALLSLALLWPWACIAIKRLHDMGRSGGLAIAFMAIGAVLSVLSTLGASLGAAAVPLLLALGTLATLAMLASLAFLVWLALSPSQPGDNRFGPPAPAFSL